MSDELPLFPDDTEVQGTGETVDDLAPLQSDEVRQAVVWSTDWTTETIISQINKKNIALNPSFQRRDAWEGGRKSRFIESLILGLPIPQLVLAESKEKRGAYIVIDGKQRLLSIRQFAAPKDDPAFDQLKLSGLTIRSDLQRATLEKLKSDPVFEDDLASFENQSIRTVIIKNWGTEDFLYQVFLRLNTGSVPLSPQELRQALHPGGFVDFADIASGESAELQRLLKIKKPDFRMRDAELLIRYYAFMNYAVRYSGDLKAFLDLACKNLNAGWAEQKDSIEIQLDIFKKAFDIASAIFGPNHVFRKWTGKNYEKPFNRAIFDIILYYFSQPSVGDLAITKPREIEDAFRNLCETNSDFLSSIEKTTKSMWSAHTRFSVWADTLNGILGTKLAAPVPAPANPQS